MTESSLIVASSAVAALVVAAAASLVACLLILADRQLRRLPRGLLSVFLLSAAIATVSAQKANTNSLNGGSSSTSQGGTGLPPVHADFHFSPFALSPPTGGFRLDGVATNEEHSYAMPTNGEVRGTWHLRGAYEDVTRVDLGGFAFPLGSEVVTSLWAHTWGLVRPHLASPSNEVAVVGAPMSAVPGVSRFWTAPTPSNTYLLTWQDFAPGRVPLASVPDTSSLVSAQLELLPFGDFVARSNLVARIYRRANPDDLDGDGWLNEDDANPDAFDGGGFGPHQTLPEGANSNAYCWVDLVVSPADATVAFEGDGPSGLPDPRFVAKAGATNRVVILVGKTYKVTCDMPIVCVGQSSDEIEAEAISPTEIRIVWPVAIWAEGDDEPMSAQIARPSVGSRFLPPLLPRPRLLSSGGGARSFTMHVVPSGLGGAFVWTNVCCAVSGSGTRFSYTCDGACLCVSCAADGFYGYEGYSLPATGGWCGCAWGETDRCGSDDDPSPAPGVSVSFSERAVIFEDGYESAPGSWVARRSTRATLVCAVHGGTKGGTATFACTNLEKLDGGVLLPTVVVPAGRCITYEIGYGGRLPSGGADDIVVRGTFVENNAEPDAAPLTSESRLTSVRVELEAVYVAPENASQSRHVYGVGEKVKFKVTPALSAIGMSVVKADFTDNTTAYDTFSGEQQVDASAERVYTCPAAGTVPAVAISLSDVGYSPALTVVEPQCIITPSATGSGTFSPGDVCMGTLRTENYIGPKTVSFRGVKVFEVPCMNAIPPTGYFATANFDGCLTHGFAAGAGPANRIGAGNYWAIDEAGRSVPYANWSSGRLEWKIPIGWKRCLFEGDGEPGNGELEHELHGEPTSRPLLIGGSEDAYLQTFKIESNGTSSVEKFGYRLSRYRWWPFGEVVKIGTGE